MAKRAWMMLLFSSLVSASCDHSSIRVGKDAGGAPDGARDAVAPGADAAPDTEVPAADADAAPDVGHDLPATPEVARADEPAPDRTPDRVAPPDEVGTADSPPDLSARDAVPDALVPDLAADAPKADGPADLAADVASETREAGPDWTPFAVDGALAGFCSGDSPRLVVNGAASSPTVTGAMIPYDCCDGGQFNVTSPAFALPIVFSWRRMSSSAWVYPATADLANLPTGWSVWFYAGCNPISSSCGGSSDYYTTGFEGTLQLASSAGAFDMSLCLHVQEPAASPHAIIHSMDLYAPHVPAR